MSDEIKFTTPSGEYTVPNSWESLTPELFIGLCTDLSRMSQGQASVMEIRVRHVCRAVGLDPEKLSDPTAFENLSLLAEKVDFIFSIMYPDNNSALSLVDPGERAHYLKTPPYQISGTMGSYLSRLNYHYVLDAVFCRQLLPVLQLAGHTYSGYRIDTSYDALTCSLTALQYLEARENRAKLPLMAAILYCPEPYDSEKAHFLSQQFSELPADTLDAIALNFQAFDNFLFNRTHFSLLTAGAQTEQSKAITTGALDSLYDLSTDGYGDMAAVESMNIIKYLTILRKKLIEAVRAMHRAKMEIIKIHEETGLPFEVINKILL